MAAALTAVPVGPPAIEVGTAAGAPGQQVPLAVTLRTGGALVGGTQHDIGFSAPIAVAERSDGRPDCVALGDFLSASSFAFQPTGCKGASCTGIRALVLSVDGVTAIADGSVLYSCNLNVAADAVSGQYPLPISGVIVSDTDGRAIPNPTGVNGSVIVTVPASTPTPTRTIAAAKTPSSTPTLTRTSSPLVSLDVGMATGARGQHVTFDVTLRTGNAQVAGVQNDISFDSANIAIAAKPSGSPDCVVNPEIEKQATSFSFRPHGCSGITCTAIEALVFSVSNSDPILDGSVLYTCTVRIAATASYVAYPLVINGIVASGPTGDKLAATGTDGEIVVSPLPPTATPTPTATATPARPVIAVGSATDLPNHHVQFAVSLDTLGNQVAAAQVDIAFDHDTPIDANPNGSPQCVVNPDIGKGGTSFRFEPADCVPGVDCSGVHAMVIAFDSADPIADGATLFTCTAAIRRTAQPQPYPLVCSGPQTSDVTAHGLPATCVNGSIVVQMPCRGDCNGDNEVTIDELLTGVAISLGGSPYDQCPAFDSDRNRDLSIDELLQGVLDALNGCPSLP